MTRKCPFCGLDDVPWRYDYGLAAPDVEPAHLRYSNWPLGNGEMLAFIGCAVCDKRGWWNEQTGALVPEPFGKAGQ